MRSPEWVLELIREALDVRNDVIRSECIRVSNEDELIFESEVCGRQCNCLDSERRGHVVLRSAVVGASAAK